MSLKIFKTKCGITEKVFISILTISITLPILHILITSPITLSSLLIILILITILSILFFIAYVDFKKMEVLDIPSLLLMFFLVIVNMVLHFKLGTEKGLVIGSNWEYIPYDNFMGALILGLPFLLIVLITKEKALGSGDVRIAIITGLLIGQNNILLWLYITVFSSLIYGLIIGKKKRKFKNLKIPFVPFMILGIVICLISNIYI